jgi:magnesium-transporting ATPase (P-type)
MNTTQPPNHYYHHHHPTTHHHHHRPTITTPPPLSGLADEAAARLLRYGENALTPPRKATFLERLWSQLNNVVIFVLFCAAVVEGALQVRCVLGGGLCMRSKACKPGLWTQV